MKEILTPEQDAGPLGEAQIQEIAEALISPGFYVCQGVITTDEAAEVRRETLALAKQDAAAGIDNTYGDGLIRRVWALVAKHECYRRLIQHPTVMAVWQRVLGRDVVASTFTANIVSGGSPPGGWHVDYPYWAMEPPFPEGALTGQTVWMLDDFTENNGATQCIVDSHKTRRGPKENEADNEPSAIATGRAGSVLFTNGAIWHRCMANQTKRMRVGLLGMYNRAVILPQEDMPRQRTDAELEGESETLRQLLGRHVPYRDQASGVERRRTATGFADK